MRQGKVSELIHNSGTASSSSSEDVTAENASNDGEDADDGFFDPEEYDSQDDEAYRKGGKGKGKAKGKGKKRAAASAYSAGGCDYATVEIWFREIIESVSPA